MNNLAIALQELKRGKSEKALKNLIISNVFLWLETATVSQMDEFIETSGLGIDKSLNKDEKIEAIISEFE